MYCKIARKYKKNLVNGISFEKYIINLVNISIYYKLYEKKLSDCNEINKFFANLKKYTWKDFEGLPRIYLFNYLIAKNVLKNTKYIEFYKNNTLPSYIEDYEPLSISGDPCTSLLKDHFFGDIDSSRKLLYEELITSMNNYTSVSIKEIRYMVVYSYVFSKEQLRELISIRELRQMELYLIEHRMLDELVLLNIITNSISSNSLVDYISNEFETLTFESKILFLMQEYAKMIGENHEE